VAAEVNHQAAQARRFQRQQDGNSGAAWEKSRNRDFSLAAESARSPRQAPLHGHHAAGIAAAHDDAEIGARLVQRLRIDVGLGGRLGVILVSAQM
jgi:hypothetical protein